MELCSDSQVAAGWTCTRKPSACWGLQVTEDSSAPVVTDPHWVPASQCSQSSTHSDTIFSTFHRGQKSGPEGF